MGVDGRVSRVDVCVCARVPSSLSVPDKRNRPAAAKRSEREGARPRSKQGDEAIPAFYLPFLSLPRKRHAPTLMHALAARPPPLARLLPSRPRGRAAVRVAAATVEVSEKKEKRRQRAHGRTPL